MIKRVMLAISLCMLSATVLATGVYRWVDEEGRVHYSDKRQSEDVDIVTVDASSPSEDNSYTPSSTENAQEGMSEEEQVDEKDRLAEVRKRLAEEEAKVRKKNCGVAQKNYDQLMNTARLFEPEEDGGRRYLDSDEIDERREHARNQIEQWCDE